MDNLLNDLHYTIRMLIKRPGFTIVALITLALGIGANTSIFSVVNAVLLRPLPYSQPDKIMQLWEVNLRTGAKDGSVSPYNFIDWQQRNTTFECMSAYRYANLSLTGGDQAERIVGSMVSADFFKSMGVSAAVGRTFSPEEDQPGQSNVAVLGYGLWQRRFGLDEKLIGQSILLNGQKYTVLGVMPRGFQFPGSSDMWLPLALDMSKEARGHHYLRVVGRLKPDVTVGQAQADIANIGQQLTKEFPDNNRYVGAYTLSLRDEIVKDVKSPLMVLLGSVVLVLLIACANVANLLLVRTASRKREIAIRTALGASRWRLARQLLTESLVLSLIGGGLGLLLSLWGTYLLDKIIPGNIPRAKEINIDRNVLLFTFVAAVLSGIVFGLAPAVQSSRTNLQENLKESGRGAAVGFRNQILRNMLVVSEIAIALVLLIGAGLLMKSFYKLSQVDPGFRGEGVVTAQFTMSAPRYNDGHARIAFSRDIAERLSVLPGVMSAGATSEVPFNGSTTTSSFSIVGRQQSPDDVLSAGARQSLPGYFKTMGIPLLQGRDFNDGDGPDSMPVAIINHSFAERYFQNENPLGRHIRFDIDDNSPGREIVGGVGDVKHEILDSTSPMEMYAPYTQDNGNRTLVAVCRTDNPKAIAPMIRDAFKAADPNQPVFNIRTMDDRLVSSVRPQRFTMILLGVFASIALILAAIGIYGVMSYSVTQRTHEIGIRMALGARPRKVLQLIIGQGMSLAIIGVVMGVVGALGLKYVMEGLLFGVSGTDRTTFIGLSLLLGFVALLANYIPARRATKVDPMIAMRYE